MNTEFYKNKIEKIATQDEVVLNDDKANKFKDGVKRVVKSGITAKANSGLQGVMSNGGALAGTLIAKKRGADLGKAIATGGLGGMAVGDLVGSLTIPTYQLHKKHKKEFGEAPDAKSLATVLGANALPTAALWAGALGVPKVRKSLQKGLQSAPKHVKTIMDLPAGVMKDIDAINRVAKSGDMDALQMAIDHSKSNIRSRTRKGISGVESLAKSTASLGIAGSLAEMPTYFATPQNIIDAKKKRIEDQAQQN